MKTVLGIDVSKEHLDCALLEATASNNQRAANRRRSAGRRGGCACSWREANTPAGHAALVRNIQARHQAQPGSSWLVVMESTGIYSEALHRALFAAGIPAACVNPRQVRDFAASLNLRAKTDPVDARLLARYGAERQPPAQAPLSAQHQILRGLVNELDALVEDRLRLQNRRESSSTKDPVSSPEALSALHQEHLAFLDRQIATVQERINAHIAADPDLHAKSRLLCTIPGIAERTAARLLVILDERSFPSARALAAYAGLTPAPCQSGNSLKPARLCKIGNARLRKTLYMPASVAARFCAPLRAWAESLLARGKTKMTVRVAVMRKLLHIIFGVLKHRSVFDPTKAAIPQPLT
jgi:transposase